MKDQKKHLSELKDFQLNQKQSINAKAGGTGFGDSNNAGWFFVHDMGN